jgi:hypothetical protein
MSGPVFRPAAPITSRVRRPGRAGDARPSNRPPRSPSPESAATTSPHSQRSPQTAPPSPGTSDRPPPTPQPDPEDLLNRVSPSMLAPNPSQHLESEINDRGNPYFYDSDLPNPALGPVDSMDSQRSRTVIQGFLLEGGDLGRHGSAGFERRAMGEDIRVDHWPAGPEGFDRARQPDVCRGGAVDRTDRLAMARPAGSVWRVEQRVSALQPVERERGVATHLRGAVGRSRFRIPDYRFDDRARPPARQRRKRGLKIRPSAARAAV